MLTLILKKAVGLSNRRKLDRQQGGGINGGEHELGERTLEDGA